MQPDPPYQKPKQYEQSGHDSASKVTHPEIQAKMQLRHHTCTHNPNVPRKKVPTGSAALIYAPSKSIKRFAQAQEMITHAMKKQTSATTLMSSSSMHNFRPEHQYLKKETSQPLIPKSMFKKIYNPRAT